MLVERLVRLARAEDGEAIRSIYNVEVTESTVTFDLVPRSAEDQRAWLITHSGPHPAVVAVDNDQLVGFGSLSPYRDRPAYATTVEDSVYVHRDWRGDGVGRRLLEDLVRLGGDHGFHTVVALSVGGDEASTGPHSPCGLTLVRPVREVD